MVAKNEGGYDRHFHHAIRTNPVDAQESGHGGTISMASQYAQYVSTEADSHDSETP